MIILEIKDNYFILNVHYITTTMYVINVQARCMLVKDMSESAGDCDSMRRKLVGGVQQ